MANTGIPPDIVNERPEKSIGHCSIFQLEEMTCTWNRLLPKEKGDLPKSLGIAKRGISPQHHERFLVGSLKQGTKVFSKIAIVCKLPHRNLRVALLHSPFYMFSNCRIRILAKKAVEENMGRFHRACIPKLGSKPPHRTTSSRIKRGIHHDGPNYTILMTSIRKKSGKATDIVTDNDSSLHTTFLYNRSDVIGCLIKIVRRYQRGLPTPPQIKRQTVKVTAEVLHLWNPKRAITSPTVYKHEGWGTLAPLVVTKRDIPYF
tara:strand:- start:7325 stop:8104 length:780 start_codon:yes stop_codon:yes gene_type:complete